jgi:hypothetical protein
MADAELRGFIETEYPRLVGVLGFYTQDTSVAIQYARVPPNTVTPRFRNRCPRSAATAAPVTHGSN